MDRPNVTLDLTEEELNYITLLVRSDMNNDEDWKRLYDKLLDAIPTIEF